MPTCTRKIIFTIKWIEGLTVFNLLMGTNTAARDYNKAEWWLVDWPLMGGLLWYTGPRWVGCNSEYDTVKRILSGWAPHQEFSLLYQM